MTILACHSRIAKSATCPVNRQARGNYLTRYNPHRFEAFSHRFMLKKDNMMPFCMLGFSS
jgi:hypothetical protein